MKNAGKIVSLIVAGGLMTITSSCKKSDGLSFGESIKADMLAKTWKVDKYYKEGIDKTSDFKNITNINYTETFTTEGVWSYSYTDGTDSKKPELKEGTGKWEYDKKSSTKDIIDRNGGGSTWEEIYIIKLTATEFSYWYMDSGDKKEMHLIPNS